MSKFISTFLVFLITAMFLTACNNGNTAIDTTTTEAGITSVQTTISSVDNEFTSPETTYAPIETTASVGEVETLEVNWHLGYVGSSSHSTYAYTINNGGAYYSYSDIITIEKAGTAIWFEDANINSNGDTGFASNAAFIISSWKLISGKWLIDKEGTNISGSGSTNSSITISQNGIVTYRYVTSKDNENIRLCFRSGQSSSFIPSSFPTVYSQFTAEPGTEAALEEILKNHENWIAESKKTSYYNILEGITMNVIGDSYFAGDSLESKYVWCSLLAEKYNMLYSNKGQNGSTISNYVTTNNPIVYRYTNMPLNNANIILIEGGKNDFNMNVPIGTNNDTVTTYKGAIKFLIEKIQTRYPDALIICVTVWNVAETNTLGNTISDYGDAMIEICNLYNIPCFNAMDIRLSGVDMTSATFRNQYCLTPSDISHLNILGHRMVMPNFEKFIAEQYEAFIAAKKA